MSRQLWKTTANTTHTHGPEQESNMGDAQNKNNFLVTFRMRVRLLARYELSVVTTTTTHCRFVLNSKRPFCTQTRTRTRTRSLVVGWWRLTLREFEVKLHTFLHMYLKVYVYIVSIGHSHTHFERLISGNCALKASNII